MQWLCQSKVSLEADAATVRDAVQQVVTGIDGDAAIKEIAVDTAQHGHFRGARSMAASCLRTICFRALIGIVF